MKKAVCLLSGGLDSSTVLAIAKSEGYSIFALTVDYGQRHKKEIGAAKNVAKFFGVKEHKTIRVPLSKFGGSSLVDKKMPIPQNRKMPKSDLKIPSTYVPARNIIFLSLAFAYAEAKRADAVFIGANAIDYSGYPDCKPEFFDAFREALAEGTKSGRKILLETPLVSMTKAQIIRTGVKLGVPYGLTWSCYQGGKKPCNRCDSCLLHGFFPP